MSLEKILRYLAVGSLGSAGTIFSVLSYRSFERGDNISSSVYAALALISAASATLFYKYHSRKINSEETGFFGLPNRVMEELEKKNSSGYRAQG